MRAPWPTQVLFLLYHYFNAGEMYNAIRVFIAAYVWMTGFGNYLYYYKTNDFGGVRRACKLRTQRLAHVKCAVNSSKRP